MGLYDRLTMVMLLFCTSIVFDYMRASTEVYQKPSRAMGKLYGLPWMGMLYDV